MPDDSAHFRQLYEETLAEWGKEIDFRRRAEAQRDALIAGFEWIAHASSPFLADNFASLVAGLAASGIDPHTAFQQINILTNAGDDCRAAFIAATGREPQFV
jgi:hypothetical protein